jgi:hypothetical protein
LRGRWVPTKLAFAGLASTGSVTTELPDNLR